MSSSSSRDRPSRSMRTSRTSGTSGGSSGGDDGSGGGIPSFMAGTEGQYASLSERLAREEEEEPGGGSSRRVRWAETAAAASTMDAANAADGEGVSPMDALADLFARKYTLPAFLVATAGIFLLVHLSGTPDGTSVERYEPQANMASVLRSGTVNTYKNVDGGEDGFGSTIFSLSPTGPGLGAGQESGVPTILARHHLTPRISPSAASSDSDGNEGLILVPTATDARRGDGSPPSSVKWGFGPGIPTPDPVYLKGAGPGGPKWNYAPGMPTPDPVFLALPDRGSPTTLKWNLGPGAPTPDPAMLVEVAGARPDAASPTTLKLDFQWGGGEGGTDGPPGPDPPKWNYPPGVPTPNPALLVEVAGPDSGREFGSVPVPAPGGAAGTSPVPPPSMMGVEVAPPGAPGGPPTTGAPAGVDRGSPTNLILKWNYPPGIPTPDPAYLAGTPEEVTWGYPPGIPTPDPALLTGGDSTVVEDGTPLTWDYPEGVPTPDPAYLTQTNVDPVGWGYPEGEPTPDPVFLNGLPPVSESPTRRNVEVGLVPPTKYPTRKPTPLPTPPPVQLKMNLQTQEPTTAAPAAPASRRPKQTVPEIPADTPSTSPIVPPAAEDGYGNIIELAPVSPPARPRPKVVPVKTTPPPAPEPEVEVLPAAPDQYTFYRPLNPEQEPGDGTGDESYAGYNGPNGFTIERPENLDPTPAPVPDPPQVPQFPGVVPQIPQYVIPQQPCGCCCCQCGAGLGGGYAAGMVGGYALPGGMLPMTAGQGMLPQTGMLPMTGSNDPNAPQVTVVEPPKPACPWTCQIDENVPTRGESNEDDALYEIFYTNPLNCCGTIVEIGAGNGFQHSVSYFFEQGMNWTAYLTEADPQLHGQMISNRPRNKGFIRKGAYCKDGPELFFDEDSRTFKSQTSGDFTSEKMGDFVVELETPTVPCIRLDRDVVAGLDHVNVFIINVPGDPWAVIRTMDWDVIVDIWVLRMDDGSNVYHDTARASLRLHDYVPAAWDIKLWCDTPSPDDCKENEVWLRKGFNPIHKEYLSINRHLLRGSGTP